MSSKRPRSQRSFIGHAIIAIAAFGIFVALHIAQERWSLKMCDASNKVNVTLPKSCELLILRLWIAPGIIVLLMALIGSMRVHLGSFSKTRNVLRQLFERISKKEFTGLISAQISLAATMVCATSLLLWQLVARHGSEIFNPKNHPQIPCGFIPGIVGDFCYQEQMWHQNP